MFSFVQLFGTKRLGSSSQCNRVLVISDGAYRVLQILSLFLLGQHMDDGVRRLVVEVSTDASDESLDVVYAFVRREYTFEGI